MDKADEISRQIKDYAAKLEKNVDEETGEPVTKRVKKRIWAKLGKLKKDLEDAQKNKKIKDDDHNHDEDDHDDDNDDGGEDGTERKKQKFDTAATQQKQPPVNRKQQKQKLRLLNQELSELAQKKQLKQAKKRFEWGVKKGLPVDAHSYTNLLNAHARCGDMAGAEDVLQQMLSRSSSSSSSWSSSSSRPVEERNPKLAHNIITYTTLLKGYSDLGDLENVKRVFDITLIDPLCPNARTLNTFLRCCARVGASASAHDAYVRYLQRQSDKPSLCADRKSVV